MSKPTITFIGAGNMAKSIIGGLIAKGYPAQNIIASDPMNENLQSLNAMYSIQTTQDNIQAASQADVIILAVKPQVLKKVAQPLQPALSHQPVIVSIAAGISSQSLSNWLGDDLAIVRCMPNTPALVQAGASSLYANDKTTDKQKQLAEEILNAVGLTTWLQDEILIDAVTAVSGSGPAYFFLVMEAMIQAGIDQGLDPETAKRLTLQTALGAAKLAQASDVSVTELRHRVMSPGGTTERAVQSFENDDISSIFKRAMDVCAQRSAEMSKEMGS